MISRWLPVILLVTSSTACTGTRGPSPVPTPSPTGPLPQQAPAAGAQSRTWTFQYASGPLSYQISRSAVVESADSLGQREITTNAAHEVIVLERTELGVEFTAVADTFITTTQGLIGSAQPIQLPIQVSGSLVADSLTFNSPASVETCSPVSTVLITDLHNLLIPFPAVLSAGMTWRDSLSVPGCQSGITTLSHVIRSYAVSGEVMFDGRPVILVLRNDTTQIQGEGALQQHRVSINAAGTGTASYFLNPATGQLAHLTLNQTLDLGVTTTARVYHFRQTSKQDFNLSP